MAEPRIVTLEEIKAEIREFGVSKMARRIGCSRTHLQRVCGGQRKPGKRILAALEYQPITLYRDVIALNSSKRYQLRPHKTQNP